MTSNRKLQLVDVTAEVFKRAAGYEPSEVEAWIQFVSPKMAKELLKGTATFINRNVRRRHVARISRDMRRKKYDFTGEPIILDRQGEVIDGQHRLLAAIESKVGFIAVIVRGIERAVAVRSINGGAPRRHGDRLKMLYPDIVEPHEVAAVCIMFHQFKNGAGNSAPSFMDVEQVFLMYKEDVQWAVSAIGRKIEPGWSSGGAPIKAAFALAYPVDKAAVESAALSFKTAQVTSRSDPMKKLRSFVSVLDERVLPTDKKDKHGKKKVVYIAGNKSTSSMSTRYQTSLVALGYIERVLTGQKLRSPAQADPKVIDRIFKMRNVTEAAAAKKVNKQKPGAA